MPRRLASNILTEEQLINEIMGLKSILPKELYDYFFSLLSLEVSALSREDITQDQFIALSDLNTFRELVFYNIYKIAQSYINPTNGKYVEEDYTNGYNITYGDYKTKDTLFNISRIPNGKSVVRLYNPDEPSFEDVLLSYDKKVSDLEEYVQSFNKRFSNESASSNSEFSLNQLKKLTIDDLKAKHDLLIEIVRHQNAFYNTLLCDSHLVPDLEQLQRQDDCQEASEGCVKVLVSTTKRTPYFY